MKAAVILAAARAAWTVQVDANETRCHFRATPPNPPHAGVFNVEYFGSLQVPSLLEDMAALKSAQRSASIDFRRLG